MNQWRYRGYAKRRYCRGTLIVPANVGLGDGVDWHCRLESLAKERSGLSPHPTLDLSCVY